MELCVLKIRVQIWIKTSKRDLWVLGSEGGNTTGFSHICHAHPREAQQAANTKVFITLHPLLFIIQIRTKQKNNIVSERARPVSVEEQKADGSRRMKCPPLIGRPMHSSPIDTSEISSRQLLILVIYNRRDCACCLGQDRAEGGGATQASPKIKLIKTSSCLTKSPFVLC